MKYFDKLEIEKVTFYYEDKSEYIGHGSVCFKNPSVSFNFTIKDNKIEFQRELFRRKKIALKQTFQLRYDHEVKQMTDEVECVFERWLKKERDTFTETFLSYLKKIDHVKEYGLDHEMIQLEWDEWGHNSYGEDILRLYFTMEGYPFRFLFFHRFESKKDSLYMVPLDVPNIPGNENLIYTEDFFSEEKLEKMYTILLKKSKHRVRTLFR